MPKTITVTLDDKEYKITELRSRPNAAWRKKLEGPFAELAQGLTQAPETDLTDMQALGHLVQRASGLLLGSIDLVKQLTIDYAPDLAGAIDNAYDSEILEVFTGILGLAYPFGSLIGKIRALGDQVKQS